MGDIILLIIEGIGELSWEWRIGPGYPIPSAGDLIMLNQEHGEKHTEYKVVGRSFWYDTTVEDVVHVTLTVMPLS